MTTPMTTAEELSRELAEAFSLTEHADGVLRAWSPGAEKARAERVELSTFSFVD